ncbi:MAG: RluA family pseudouridine synthase [Erysipelotrichaceae bacterium]|nr:RluA family pseudouridine synthase [Erysipelotrichaceae bacterium]MDY5251999.1 RluA family pseudouridine synthase [Erysipelotrichaceae bacterium]
MINIIYEDNHLLVVEKPCNIVVQADNTQDEDLLTILKQYLKEKYQKPNNVYLGLVHRLDRPVGGIMVFAKTSKAASRLSDQIRTHTFKKTYLAVVCSDQLPAMGHLENYLAKNNKTNMVYEDKKNGKLAILDYQVIAQKQGLSLVKIDLKTGRPHQIRVQFALQKAPLYADQRYNKQAASKQQIALWAHEISFIHPTTKEPLRFILDKPARYPFNLF